MLHTNPRRVFLLVLFALLGGTGQKAVAQANPKVQAMSFKQAARFYKFWENKLYGLQYTMTHTYMKDADIVRIERMPALMARMEKDIKEHPAYFKLYPKQLKNIRQSQSMDQSNYRTFTAFRMAGDNEDPPADGKVYLDFYKRYCYWRKLVDDNADTILKMAAQSMLEAEKTPLNKRAEKLKFTLRYCRAMKYLFPNNPKADMILKRTLANTNESGKSVGGAAYYQQKAKALHSQLRYLYQAQWSPEMVIAVKEFNFPEFYKRMAADKAKHPEYFKIYPSILPGSGMGLLTKKNAGAYAFCGLAGASEKPPQNADAIKVIKFYHEYCFWKKSMDSSRDLARNLRAAIVKADQAKLDYKFEKAAFAKDYAHTLAGVVPENSQVEDLVAEADETYGNVLTQLKHMFTGKFHENHLQKIVIFGKKPVWGREKEADAIQTITVGRPAYITGFFTAKNSLGLPTLVLMNEKTNSRILNSPQCWSRSNDLVKVPMFDQMKLKKQYKSKAYFTFNAFPDVEKTNYESHVQYIPHLNFIKWLIYQPSEVLTFKIKWGKTKNMAEGRLRIDLTGDNKKKLKEYFKALEAKRLSMVRFPNMCGTADARKSIVNYADLSKYGKVLRITMKKAGNIMKPWPHDHEVDWNTAKGFAAVEKSNGKVVILPLDFRKKPNAGRWKWWSLGSFPGLFPVSDANSEINAVRKTGGGYEILKKNVNKNGTWYEM